MSDNNKNSADNKTKPAQLDEVIVDFKNALSSNLSELVKDLLRSAESKLLDMSNHADNNEHQVRYFELRNQLKLLGDTIAVDFNANIKHYLVPAADFKERQKQDNDEEDDELSLVEQDAMEGIVLVKGIGERAGAKYHEQISHLSARLEYLGKKNAATPKADILTPTSFCQAFDDALADHFDTPNKKTLFAMFDKEVANQLDSLYDTSNSILIEAGILPKIKLNVATSSPHTPSTASSTSVETESTDSEADEPQQAGGNAQGGGQGGGSNINGFAMTAPPGASFRRSGQYPNTAPGQQPAAATGGSGGSGSASTGGGESPDSAGGSSGGGSGGGSGGNTGRSSYYDERPDDSSGEFRHYTAGLPADQVSHVLSNYIGAPFTPDTSADTRNNESVFPQSTPQHFGHQEIINALSEIQNLPEFEQPQEGARFDSEAIKQAVLSSIARTSGGAVTKRINQIAEKTIDFIELIFDAIVDDTNISDTIKALLLRLQIPIIKASMADQEFFIYDDHPARELLDTIADIGVAITEHTDETYRFLDKTVSNILGEYELNTEVFQKALDKLREYVEEQEAITRAKEEEEQQQLLRKHARATVLKSLRATTTGKTLPEATHALILKRWPTLMFNHYLTKGKENDEWINIVLTLRHIVDSVQPITSAERLAKITRDKEPLFELTERYLNAASSSKKDVQTVMAAYMETVKQQIDDANFTKDEVDQAAATIADVDTEDEAPIEEEATEKPSIPANIMPGMWFQIYMGEDKPPRRCKLSVILVEDANLMFVTHKGELIAEKSFDEFNEEIANNTTQMIMGHSAFENAFKTVIDRLN